MTHALVVKIKNAKGLKDRDGIFSGKSDPYVRVRLVEDNDINADVAEKKMTKILNGGGADPVWNETFTFAGLDLPGTYTLRLNVLDKDYFTLDDALGEAVIDLGTLSHSKEFQDFTDFWVDGHIWKSYLSFSLSTKGNWGNSPDSADNSLKVKIKSASGLKDSDFMGMGKSDPYCIVKITDAKNHKLQEKQTAIKQDEGGNPTWDEEFVFENLEHPCAYRLHLNVYDKDRFRDDALGHTTIHLGTLQCKSGYVDYDNHKMSTGKINFSLDNGGHWGHSIKDKKDFCQCS